MAIQDRTHGVNHSVPNPFYWSFGHKTTSAPPTIHIHDLHNLGICTIFRLGCTFSESGNCIPILRLRKTVAQSWDHKVRSTISKLCENLWLFLAVQLSWKATEILTRPLCACSLSQSSLLHTKLYIAHFDSTEVQRRARWSWDCTLTLYASQSQDWYAI